MQTLNFKFKTYLSTIDKGGSHLSFGEHRRGLNIIPVFSGERIHTKNKTNFQQGNIT